jgi:hypothetical protein
MQYGVREPIDEFLDAHVLLARRRKRTQPAQIRAALPLVREFLRRDRTAEQEWQNRDLFVLYCR